MKFENLELRDWPATLTPANAEELFTRLYDKDNRKVGRSARVEEDKGEFSYGFINVVKTEIQEYNKANYGVSQSREDTRADRLLRTRDSNGKATARKF